MLETNKNKGMHEDGDPKTGHWIGQQGRRYDLLDRHPRADGHTTLYPATDGHLLHRSKSART